MKLRYRVGKLPTYYGDILYVLATVRIIEKLNNNVVDNMLAKEITSAVDTSPLECFLGNNHVITIL